MDLMPSDSSVLAFPGDGVEGMLCEMDSCMSIQNRLCKLQTANDCENDV